MARARRRVDAGARSALPSGARSRPRGARARGRVKSGRWLALDTATDLASVAVGVPPAAEAGAFVQGARRHAAEIVGLVDHALRQAGLRPADLEGVVVGDGPGSFTGLRIG